MLEDFNYLFNKAINQYVNKRYNIYDINQQTTDDLRVLKATTVLTPKRAESYAVSDLGQMMGATYEVDMPDDYLHILNCICIYNVNKTFKCYNKGDVWRQAATRLTADAYSRVLDNFWTRPSYRRPYYYIHNIGKISNGTGSINDENGYVESISNQPNNVEPISNKPNNVDSKPSKNFYVFQLVGIKNKSVNSNNNKDYYYMTWDQYDEIGPLSDNQDIYLKDGKWTSDAESDYDYKYHLISFPEYGNDASNKNIWDATNQDTVYDPASAVERGGGIRYGNKSTVRMEIRYGTDDSLFKLTKVYVDYIKAPQTIRLTQEQLDRTEDTSQLLEFPDYVCQEIINELVNIIMENIGDPRLQTHPVVSQSIANPAQQQEPAAPAAQ